MKMTIKRFTTKCGCILSVFAEEGAGSGERDGDYLNSTHTMFESQTVDLINILKINSSTKRPDILEFRKNDKSLYAIKTSGESEM